MMANIKVRIFEINVGKKKLRGANMFPRTVKCVFMHRRKIVE